MPLTDGLVHLWNLESASSPIAEEINDLNLTTIGGSPASAGGIHGNAVSLDGANDYLTETGIANADYGIVNVDDATVSLWVQPRAVGTVLQKILRHRSADLSNLFTLQFNASSPTMSLNWHRPGFTSFVNTGSIFSDDTWYHVLCRNVRNDNLYLDINGGALFSGSIFTVDSPTFNPAIDNSLEITLGAEPGTYANKFDGIIDQVAMWSRYVTDDEMSEIYNGGEGINILGGGVGVRTMPAGWLRR